MTDDMIMGIFLAGAFWLAALGWSVLELEDYGRSYDQDCLYERCLANLASGVISLTVVVLAVAIGWLLASLWPGQTRPDLQTVGRYLPWQIIAAEISAACICWALYHRGRLQNLGYRLDQDLKRFKRQLRRQGLVLRSL